MSIGSELIKLAIRREVREFFNLSPEDQQRIIENNKRIGMRHERELKTLGSGAMSEGKLVMHPQHGLVVRKSLAPIELSGMGMSFGADPAIIRRNPEIDIFDRIRQYQEKHGPSGMARVREVTPEGLVFQDYVPGNTIFKERDKQRSLRAIRNKLFRIQKAPGYLDFDAFNRYENLENRVIKRLRRPVTPKDMPAFGGLPAHIKSIYPRAFDHTSPWNVLRDAKGTPWSIDMSAGSLLPRADVRFHPASQFQARAGKLPAAHTPSMFPAIRESQAATVRLPHSTTPLLERTPKGGGPFISPSLRNVLKKVI